MQKILLYFISISLVFSTLYAKEIEHFHQEKDHTTLKFNLEAINFHHSLSKEDGNIYGVELDHKTLSHHIQLYYEKTLTSTTPAIPKDLDINKYTLKYQYTLNTLHRLSTSYIKIDDNLVAETGSGDIIGFGYDYKEVGIYQYISLYQHFNVYQTDLKLHTHYDLLYPIHLVLLGKYIHLQDKDATEFSTNAKNNYYTVGIKLHTHIQQFHFGLATFQGKRAFAVMHDGMRVQHHAMEFKSSYIAALGYKVVPNLSTTLRYEHHNVNEIIANNDDVTIDNVALEIHYKF